MQGKISLARMIGERIRNFYKFYPHFQESYWKMYTEGNHVMFAFWMHAYLGLPSAMVDSEKRYWRVVFMKEVERISNMQGLLERNLRAAGQDIEADQVAKVTGAKGEHPHVYTRGMGVKDVDIERVSVPEVKVIEVK